MHSLYGVFFPSFYEAVVVIWTHFLFATETETILSQSSQYPMCSTSVFFVAFCKMQTQIVCLCVFSLYAELFDALSTQLKEFIFIWLKLLEKRLKYRLLM